MSKNLGTNLFAARSQNYALKPILYVELLIGSALNKYSSGPLAGYKTGIINFSGFRHEAKINSIGAVATVGVTIVDQDQTIHNEIKAGTFYNKIARFGLYYDGLSGTAQDLFEGKISAPIEYDEYKQEVTFSIRTEIGSTEVGFSIEENTFSINNDVVIGKVWPRVYGRVAHVPAILAQQQPYGQLRAPITFGLKATSEQLWVEETKPWDTSDYKDIAVSTYNTITSYDLQPDDTVKTQDSVLYVDRSEAFPRQLEIKLSIEGVIFKGQFGASGDKFIVTEANAAKYENLKFVNRVSGDDDSDNPLVAWLDSPNKSILDHYILFKAKNDSGANVNDGIRFDYVNQSYIRRVDRQDGAKIWLNKPIPGSVTLRVLLDDSNTINSVKALPENTLLSDITDVIDQIRNVSFYRSVQLEDTSNSPFGAVAEQLLLISKTADAFWSQGEGTLVRQWDANPDIYVANSVPSNQILSVYGVRDYNNQQVFAPIPKEYYEKKLNKETLIPFGHGPQRVTTIEFIEPLSSMKDQGWKDEVYVSLDSTLSSNPATICESLLVDSGLEANFSAQESDVSNYPCNFLLNKKIDAIKLAEDVAWQSRSAITYDDINGAKFKYLGKRPSIVETIGENDILYGTFKIFESDESLLVTSFQANYVQSYRPQANAPRDESRFIVYEQNRNTHGNYIQEYDYYTQTDYQSVNKSARFWANRYANIWRKCSFTMVHDHIYLEPFDLLRVNINSKYFGDNLFLGLVESVTSNPTEGTVDVVLLTPYKQGSTTQDNLFWLTDNESFPINYANRFTEIDYAVQVRKDKKSIEDILKTFEQYTTKLKIPATITAINLDGFNDKVTVDIYGAGFDNDATLPNQTAYVTDQTQGVEVGEQVTISPSFDFKFYWVEKQGSAGTTIRFFKWKEDILGGFTGTLQKSVSPSGFEDDRDSEDNLQDFTVYRPVGWPKIVHTGEQVIPAVPWGDDGGDPPKTTYMMVSEPLPPTDGVSDQDLYKLVSVTSGGDIIYDYARAH